ncbi:hypothetical protein MJL22_28145, partial [Salmonella enterica subsp. enterica serovar Montevideo]|nr:hypothetical protein [Salmonella enterica subsp. enterica serovar Montevideo]
TPAVMACRKVRDGRVLQEWTGGWQTGNTFASYLHVHFAQRPEPDINPTTTIMVKISCFSVFAKRVMTPPTLFAIPVSNNAPPTM